MNKNRRVIYAIFVALLVTSLTISAMTVSYAETASTVSNDTELTSSASANTPLLRSFLTLGIALVGGAVIFRRKVP